MDHHYIEEFNLVDRYLMGKLTAEESAPFEDHFVDCPHCLDRLKTTRDFTQGLRVVTVEGAPTTGADEPRGWLWFLSPMLARKSLALASCILLAVALVSVVLAQKQLRRLRSEAHEAADAAALSEQERERTQRELTAQLHELEAKLEDAQKQRRPLAPERGWWAQPGINVPVFALNSVRAGDPNSSGAMNEIKLPRAAKGFVISVGLVGEVKYEEYHVTVIDNRNRVVWESGGLQPDRHNALSIGFNATFFRPGQYVLKVEGGMKKEELSALGNYPFRVIKST